MLPSGTELQRFSVVVKGRTLVAGLLQDPHGNHNRGRGRAEHPGGLSLLQWGDGGAVLCRVVGVRTLIARSSWCFPRLSWRQQNKSSINIYNSNKYTTAVQLINNYTQSWNFIMVKLCIQNNLFIWLRLHQWGSSLGLFLEQRSHDYVCSTPVSVQTLVAARLFSVSVRFNCFKCPSWCQTFVKHTNAFFKRRHW